MGFTKAELASYVGTTVPDLIGPGLKLLFVGINPGLWTAATQTHFAYPSNRFYPALYRAGITDHLIDHSEGMSDADEDYLIRRGIGITNIVSRATASAAELTPKELRVGGERLGAFVTKHRPAVVAVLGITAYRTAFRAPKAIVGRQEASFENSEVWVLPNPSGLNAHETVETLAQFYAKPAIASGIELVVDASSRRTTRTKGADECGPYQGPKPPT